MAEENPWAQAREASHGVILQAALADLESKAAKQEQEFMITQENLEKQQQLNSKLLEENGTLQANLGRQSSEASKLRAELETTKFTVQSLEESSKQTQERFDRMLAEGDTLREEISRLTMANSEYQQKIVTMESQAKLGDSQVLPLQFQVDRLRKEVDVMSAHNTWLNGQWQDATDQLAQMRQSHAGEIAALRSSLVEAQEDQASSTSEVARLQRLVASLEGKNERLSTELRDAKTSAAQQKADGDEELQAAQRLIRLQKTQIELLQTKHDGLVTQLESVQHHALEAEEESSHAMQLRQRDLETKSKQILESQAQAFQEQITELEGKLASANLRLKEAEDGLLLTNTPHRFTPGRPMALRDDNEEPLNLTELYVRLAETEDNLRAESLRRKKAEIALQRIEAEMGAAAPRLMRQRQEYEDAMDRENNFRQRLDAALDEAQVTREEAKQLQTELGRLQSRNQELEGETQELAKQVQTLLVSRSNAGTFGAPAGSSMSVTPSPEVIQMQQTNQKLAGQVRKLTAQIQELHGQIDSDILRRKVDAYEEELATIREDRKRQEIMATSLAQQRDLYRALLAKHDVGEETTAIEMVKRHSEKSKMLEQKVGELEQKLASVNALLATVDQDKEAAAERLARYEEVNKELTAAVDRLQTQSSQLHAEVARAQAEVTFYQNKTERLEDTLERSKTEAARITSAKAEIQRINGEMQASLSKAHAETIRYESELSQAKRMARLAETQKEQAKAAEQRLTEENDHLRTNIARQGAMIESIQRIENSLSAKAATEEESYRAQVASLTEKLAAVESQYGTTLDTLNGKLSDQEVIIKDFEKQREQTANAVTEAKEEAMKFLNELQETTKKCSSLEAQLSAAKRKLGDTSEDDVEGELRSQIASLVEELKSSRDEADKLRERCSTFEKLAKDNENAVAEQTKALNTAKEAHSSEIALLQSRLDVATTQSSKSKEIIAELTDDLAAQRDERSKELEKMDKLINELKAQSEEYRRDAESAQNRYAQLETEVIVLRTDVVSAQTNYERELSLHATARTDLRAAKEVQEAELRLRKIAEEQAAAAKAELIDQLSSFEAKTAEMESREKEYEKNLEDTRAQNALLHSQLETINKQIERIQSGKGGMAEDAEGMPEADSLHKTISELREVVRFVRADKEMIQNQLDSARRAAERERASAAIAKRSLEEARAELKVLQESTGSEIDAEGLKEKLKNCEQQIKILGESNSHLREEVTKLESTMSSLTDELEASKAASGPSEKRLKDLETEQAGYFAEKKSLLREIDDWKGRVQSLVSKFNQVDPAEHATLQKKAEGLEAQVKTLESQKMSSEEESKRIRMLASRVSKELTQNKLLVESHKKTIASLAEAKEALEKAHNDGAAKKELTETKEKLAKLETERANEKIQLAGAQEMNEKLRDRLRVFQKTIMESKHRISVLEKELKEAKEEIASLKKEPATVAAPSEPVVVVPKQPELKPSPKTAATEKVSDGKPASILPHETPKETTQKPVAKKPENAPVPSIPPGGFKFAPSSDDTKKPDLEPKGTNKRLAESDDNTIATKKSYVPADNTQGGSTSQSNTSEATGETKLAMEESQEAAKDGTKHEVPGETNEVSMKEKLLEKKRKLALAMEKKKLREKEAAAASPTKQEPSPKKSKMEVIPASETPEVAQGEPRKDSGESHGAAETGEDETKPEKAADPAPLTAASGLSAAANPFAPSTTIPFTGQSSFGILSSGGAFGSSGFGAASAVGQSASTFGFTSTPSSSATTGSTGFGLVRPSGSDGSTVFGSSSNVGFGSGSSSFLNMKPPGSSSTTPTFTFGSSTSIVLPTPANPVSVVNPFGAFSAQIQQSSFAAKPLFGARQDESAIGIEEGEEDEEEGEEGEMEDDGEQPHEPRT